MATSMAQRYRRGRGESTVYKLNGRAPGVLFSFSEAETGASLRVVWSWTNREIYGTHWRARLRSVVQLTGTWKTSMYSRWAEQRRCRA
jgi:hypothetical protein